MPDAPQQVPSARKDLTTSMGAFGLSVLLHVSILLLVGGYVIFEGVVPKQHFAVVDSAGTMSDVEVIEPEMLDPQTPEDPTAALNTNPEVQLNTAPAGDSTPADLIVSTGVNTMFSLPPAVGQPSATLGGTGIVGVAGGTNTGTAASKGPGVRSFKIFNQSVEAAGLGVLLDVSRTTHNHFPQALREVQREFSQAPIVLIMGCGLEDRPKNDGVKFLPFATYVVEPATKLASPPTLVNQLGIALSLGDDTRKALNALKASDRVWAMEVPPGGYHLTQFAFEHLAKQNVDAIYWFTDFDDKAQPTGVAQVAALLKSKGIKLIAHNFTGKPVPPAQAKLALDSGGSVISVVPGK